MSVWWTSSTSTARSRELLERCLRCADDAAWAGGGLDLERSGDTVTAALQLGGGPPADPGAWADIQAAVQLLASVAAELQVTWSVECEGATGAIGPDGPDEPMSRMVGDVVKLLFLHAPERQPWRPAASARLSRKGVQALQRRWTEDRALEVARAVLHADAGAEELVGVTGDGRLDLRGIPLAAFGAVIGQRSSKKRTDTHVIREVDLSFSPRWNDAGAPPLHTLRLVDCALDGLDLAGCPLHGSFERCSMRGARVESVWADLVGCDLSMSRARGVATDPIDCDFSYIALRGARLTEQTFTRCRFDNADLGGAQLGEARFVGCSFSGASFFDAFYGRTVFQGCTGLDPGRMLSTSCVMYGDRLCAEDDIVVQPCLPG